MILYRYVLREHIAPFIYSVIVITFLFVMDFLLNMLESILIKGLDAVVVLEIFVLNLAWILALSVPMGVLVAVLMAFGRLSSENEITAMNAAGISLKRLLIPVMLSAMIVAGGLVWFNNNVLPEANYRAATLAGDISRKKPAAFIQEGVILYDFRNFCIYIDSIDQKTGGLYGIMILETNNGKTPVLTTAKKGFIQYINSDNYLRFELFSGENLRRGKSAEETFLHTAFDSAVITMKNVDAGLKRTQRTYRSDRELSSRMMLDRIEKAGEEKAVLFDKMQKEFLAQVNSQAVSDSAGKDSALALSKIITFPSGSVMQRILSEGKHRLLELKNLESRISYKDKYIAQYMVENRAGFNT